MHQELLAIRKASGGLTVERLAHAETICQLLGSGDPYVAYNRICHEILDSELDLSIKVAAASLGLLSSGTTHLNRLDEIGSEIHLEQRQVRRYSDKGLRSLAQIISKNWPTEASPSLYIAVRQYENLWEIFIATRRLHIVEMRNIKVAVLVEGKRWHPNIPTKCISNDIEERCAYNHPIVIEESSGEISVKIVWPGEIWPKFGVEWNNAINQVGLEVLGNKVMLRLAPSDL